VVEADPDLRPMDQELSVEFWRDALVLLHSGEGRPREGGEVGTQVIF
jgi:hypothetical protein